VRIARFSGFRLTCVLAGFVAATLLVRALDEGFSRQPRPLTLFHALFGLLTALVAGPGTVLAIFVTPASSEKARGLAVGGCMVTALLALVAGTIGWLHRSAPDNDVHIALLVWAAIAFPIAALDAFLLRRGSAEPPSGISDTRP
jgi:hypothetical protein